MDLFVSKTSSSRKGMSSTLHGQMEVVFQWILPLAAFLKYMTWAATAHLATLIEPFPCSDLHWDFFHIAYPVLDGWLLFYGFSRCCCYGCSGVVVVRNLRKIPATTSHAKQMATHSKSGKLLHSSHTIHEKKMFASSHDKYSWWWWSDGDGQTAKESQFSWPLIIIGFPKLASAGWWFVFLGFDIDPNHDTIGVSRKKNNVCLL